MPSFKYGGAVGAGQRRRTGLCGELRELLGAGAAVGSGGCSDK